MLGLAAVLAAASLAHAQKDPHIAYAYPAGGRQGSTFAVLIGGQYLKGANRAYVTGGGVRVAVIKYLKHLTQGENNALRMKLQMAREKLEGTGGSSANSSGDGKKTKPSRRSKSSIPLAEIARAAGVTEDQLAAMADYRKRTADPRRQLNPQLMEEVTLQVQIASNAKAGDRELRLIAPSGMSNPLNFQIGQLPECYETEPNDKIPDAALGDRLPAVINGQILPGDVDRFSFKAAQGTRLVVSASARELIPYLADAVPGWFQAVLTLYDAHNKELAYANAFGFHQDPVILYEIPADGQYVVEIRDALYRGREDFVYRITIGEVPFLTSIFPLGGRAGSQLTLALKGWNLPQDTLKLSAYYERGRPIRWLSVGQPGRLSSNRVPFAVDTLPECLEQEPNDTPESAQEVKVPIIVNGRIDHPGDRDVFRFEGHAKEKIVAEVYARRLNSPLDSKIKLTDANGLVLAANDDYEDKGLALSTHHADSRINVTLPAEGTYYLHLADAQRKGGPDYAYRLQIRPPRPDFELRVVPSSVIARAGTCVPITVYALRRDGFLDDILLDLENPPAGFRLNGAWVPANQEKARFTLTVPPTATDDPLELQLDGYALVHGRKTLHAAIPAEAMMQAFAYQHLVPTKDWSVMVTGRGSAKFPVHFVQDDLVHIPAGKTARMRAMATGSTASEIRFELSEPPDGISIQDVSADSVMVTVVLRADAAKAKPGLKGNLIFNAFTERAQIGKDGKPKATTYRSPLGMLPAIPFEVVQP
jgi:hypothetical protein